MRDFECGIETNVNPARKFMWQAGLYRGFSQKKGPGGIRLVKARAMFNFVEDLIDNGKALGTLYYINNPQ